MNKPSDEFGLDDCQFTNYEQDFFNKRTEILYKIEGVKILVERLYNVECPHKYKPENQEAIAQSIADVSIAIGSLSYLIDRQSKEWEKHHQERLEILPKEESDPDIPF